MNECKGNLKRRLSASAVDVLCIWIGREGRMAKLLYVTTCDENGVACHAIKKEEVLRYFYLFFIFLLRYFLIVGLKVT